MKWIKLIFRMTLVLIILGLAGLAVYISQPVFGKDKAQPLPAPVSPERLEAHVRKLSVEFHPRDYKHPENLDRAAAYIKSEFEQTGGTTSEQPYIADKKSYKNIIADFGPDTPERIVVGAHYDAFGGMPGADDNASGTAGLIELARLLGQSNLTMRVELVAFTLEEPPYFRSTQQGSMVHAAALKKAGVKVLAMICLEMIGYFSDAKSSQSYPVAAMKLIYPSRGNFSAVVGRLDDTRLVRRVKRAMKGANDLPVWSMNAPPELTGIDLSDHASYWEMGYPAVMITDSAFYRNQNYHEPGDTPETLDYIRMAKVVEQTHQAVLALQKS